MGDNSSQSSCKSWNKLILPVATSVASSNEADTMNTNDESAGFRLGYEEGNENSQNSSDWLAEDSNLVRE